jgi:NAD(P)-dependent dehydrogenase (short-subunit alcohol dehydrogenase family)
MEALIRMNMTNQHAPNQHDSSRHVVDDDAPRLFRLDGRVAFLSGATGHLGRSMAAALAQAGAHVILNARGADALEALAVELRQSGYQASTACFDVTDEAATLKSIARIGEHHKRLDVIVNNASHGRAGTITTTTATDFEAAYQVNVVAAFRIVQAAVPLLRESARKTAGSSIVNVASMYGSVSPDGSIYGSSGANNPPSYGAAKAALIQFTRYAACHLAGDGIRVNCISPGPFPAARYLQNDPEFHDKLKAKVPMRRTGDPKELRGPLLFLASDASSYVTGVNLAVDGGWTAW